VKKTESRRFPNADRKGSMVGLKRVLWRPNNYRRGIRVKRFGDLNIKSSIGKLTQSFQFPVEYSFSKSNKLHFLKVSPNVKIMVAPSRVMGIWSQSMIGKVKETFLIERSSEEELEAVINDKVSAIRGVLDKYVRGVRVSLGLVPVGDYYWVRHEDWLKGDDYLDSLPKEVIIHDTVFKKVYGEGVEFLGGKGVEPTVRMKNYIKNRALEDFSPLLCERLDFVIESNVRFAENLNTHLKVLEKIGDGIDRLVKVVGRLAEKQKKLSDY